MTKMIFVNLPVVDLDASMAFYKALGFENNPHFTDETAACMVWSEAINVMLLTHAKWRHSPAARSRRRRRAKSCSPCLARVATRSMR